MINSIKRSDLFHISVFADNFIAGMQQAYAADFDETVKSEANTLKRLYDHRVPFNAMVQLENGFFVLAYPAANINDYTTQLPEILTSFLKALDIKELYLLDFLANDISVEFPFESFSKRNHFKRMISKKGKHIAYKFSVDQLLNILPLFFFSTRHGAPGIYLITANGKTEIAMDLCDDGNLHVSYPQIFESAILTAAQQAGLQIGTTQLCRQYSICYLR